MADVTMPQLGETVTEGTITRWNKKVGDTIDLDEVLFEVSTDKVDSEVPSPAAGVLTEIRVQEGETADVGAVLAVIGDAGAVPVGAGAPAATSEPTAAAASVAAQPTPAVPSAPTDEPEPRPESANTTAAAVAQEEASLATPAVVSSPAQPAGDDGPGFGGRVLSPVVRRMITDAGLDPREIPGTGAGGRITRDDVQNFIQGRGGAGINVPTPAPQQGASVPQMTPYPTAAPAPSTTVAPPTSGGPARTQPAPLPAAVAGERDTVVPFSNIRRRTAEHMVMSKQTSPHALVTIEVDYDNVDKVRKASKDRFKQEEGVSLTYLPFITRAVVDAAREFPFVNASVGANELIVHRDVNVGIAVDLDFDGLLVPVVKGADGLRLRQIARGIADVAHRARNKKLQADDITGGTFTITNPGGYGTMMTYPVINQPQVAILATDGVKKRPVAVELADGSDAIVVHPVGVLGLAWDHRAFDGAYASAFLARVKEVIETRDWSAEL